MSRLIDADALKEAFEEAHTNFELTFDINTYGDVINIINNAPTVDMNTELSVAYLKGRRQGQSDERPTGKCIDFDDYSKWLKGQAIVGFDYNRCDVLIERNGIWENAIETYLKERSEEE